MQNFAGLFNWATAAVLSAQINANTLRVVVTGNLSSGTIARVRIADVTQASRYSRDAAPYSVTLAP